LHGIAGILVSIDLIRKEKKAIVAIVITAVILSTFCFLSLENTEVVNYSSEYVKIERGGNPMVVGLSGTHMVYEDMNGIFFSGINGENRTETSLPFLMSSIVINGEGSKVAFIKFGLEIYDIHQDSFQNISYNEIMYNSYPSRGSDIKYLSWSPGDERIAFILKNNTNPYTLYIWNPGEETCSPVFNSSYIFYLPSWSPDGSRLSVMARDNSGKETSGLYIIDLVNSSVIPVASGIGDPNDYNPETSEWSQEGNEIVYSSNGDIIICDTSGNERLRIPCCEDCVCQKLEWSPGGDRILYMFKSPEKHFTVVGIAESGGSGTKTLLRAPDMKRIYYPYWTENGSKVVYYFAGGHENCFIIDPEVPGWDTFFRFVLFCVLFTLPACFVAGWFFMKGSGKR
jgi:hypothetical protein